jgi:hypothetical protein
MAKTGDSSLDGQLWGRSCPLARCVYRISHQTAPVTMVSCACYVAERLQASSLPRTPERRTSSTCCCSSAPENSTKRRQAQPCRRRLRDAGRTRYPHSSVHHPRTRDLRRYANLRRRFGAVKRPPTKMLRIVIVLCPVMVRQTGGYHRNVISIRASARGDRRSKVFATGEVAG